MAKHPDRPLRLDTGEQLLTYEQAAHRLGVSKSTLVKHWIGGGWLKPSPYRQGAVRYLKVEDVARAAAERGRRRLRQLLHAADAATYLGVSVRRFRQLVAVGRLREAMPGHGLYARADLDRVLLHLNGIDDPVSKAEAARLVGLRRTGLDRQIAAGRLTAVTTGGHYVWISRRAVAKFAAAHRRQKAQLAGGLRSGKYLRTSEAARRLEISEAALFKAFKRGAIKPVEFELLRRTVVAATEVERARAAMARATSDRRTGTPAWPRASGLRPDMMTVAQAAELLQVTKNTVLHHVKRGRLVPAGRGTWGSAPAYGFECRDVQALLDAQRRRAQLLDTRAAANVLGITAKQVKGLARRGLLPVAERGSPGWFYVRAVVAKLAKSKAVVEARERRRKLKEIRSRASQGP